MSLWLYLLYSYFIMQSLLIVDIQYMSTQLL